MQYSNIATVTLNQAATIVESLIPLNLRPQFLWGAYGVGKSSIVRSIVASLSEQTGKPWGFIDARASQLDAVDTRGVPNLIDGRTVFALPDWLPRVDRDGEQGILFLDEILLGSLSVQSALYQLINDRQLGDYVLPEGWRIVAASNRSCDGAGVHGRQDAALMTRFSVQLNVVPDVDEFIDYAAANDYAPEVIAFIANRGRPVLRGNGDIDQPGLLHEYPNGGIPKGHTAAATPRGWESVSGIVKAGLPKSLEHSAIEGAIGKGAAAEFAGFLQICRNLPDAGLILRDPDSVDAPADDQLSTKYAIATILGQRVDITNIDNAVRYLRRVDEELLAVFFLIAVNRDSNLKACESYVQFKLDTQRVSV